MENPKVWILGMLTEQNHQHLWDGQKVQKWKGCKLPRVWTVHSGQAILIWYFTLKYHIILRLNYLPNLHPAKSTAGSPKNHPIFQSRKSIWTKPRLYPSVREVLCKRELSQAASQEVAAKFGKMLNLPPSPCFFRSKKPQIRRRKGGIFKKHSQKTHKKKHEMVVWNLEKNTTLDLILKLKYSEIAWSTHEFALIFSAGIPLCHAISYRSPLFFTKSANPRNSCFH